VSELRTKLADEVLDAVWDDLAPHHARGAMIVADGTLDLLDVAEAIARDDQQAVVAWLGEGTLNKASPALAEAWAAADPSPRFQAVIVQPFVVVQVL